MACCSAETSSTPLQRASEYVRVDLGVNESTIKPGAVTYVQISPYSVFLQQSYHIKNPSQGLPQQTVVVPALLWTQALSIAVRRHAPSYRFGAHQTSEVLQYTPRPTRRAPAGVAVADSPQQRSPGDPQRGRRVSGAWGIEAVEGGLHLRPPAT
ncbi:hypothetical protein Vafri_16360 [Volvox africanus]|uniref:Uncharacterized protein n=1 Tax=Volvox africanus TaxID=51714 RepID=A0A8J4BJN9_9CHLO|nr:hypothetical protein Vafri_16360 [Volvox africanus]